MVIEQEKQGNRNQYFYLELNLDDLDDENLIEQAENAQEAAELSFRVLSAKDEIYSFQSLESPSNVYFFKTEDRKRLSQIRRVIESTIPAKYLNDYRLQSSHKNAFYESVQRFKLSSTWKSFSEPTDSMAYDGSDLKIFEDRSNFYPWQSQIYDLIFDNTGNIRDADDRKIITIVDKGGKKGKSSFIKYLCWGRLSSIAKLGYGQSHQLRSSVIGGGPKDVYIIDLPRTRGKNDNIEDLLSVIEEVKNGFLTSSMYGKSKHLMMRPPFVLVFSNDHLPYGKLSKDRWECYEMTESEKPKLNPISIRDFLVKEKIKK